MRTDKYYPFGLQTANSWTRENTTGNNFLANGGTELNATTSLYDLDYRNYDPVLGRLSQVDPMADKYAGLTPYNFSFNNPVMLNDPSGADPSTGSIAYGTYVPGPRWQVGDQSTWMHGGGFGVSGGPRWDGNGGYYYDANGNGMWDGADEASMSWGEVKGFYGSSLSVSVFSGDQVASMLASYGSDTYGKCFSFQAFGKLYGGNFVVIDGTIESIAYARSIKVASGALLQIGDMELVGFQSQGNGSNGWDQFWSGFAGSGSQNSTDFSSRSTVTGTAFMWTESVNAAVRFGGQGRSITELRGVVKAGKLLGKIGVIGGVATTLLTIKESRADGNVTTGESFKIGFGLAQVGAAVLLASTPVGWGILAYNLADFGVGVFTGTTITDRIANGIDNIGK